MNCVKQNTEVPRKPAWLNKKIRLSDCAQVRQMLGEYKLNTVCQQAACPNIGECFAASQATFLILGKYCTRGCAFCNIGHHAPEPVDADEPRRLAEAVRDLKLAHVVITSVTRDDLPDGGAGQFTAAIRAVRKASPGTRVEILIPDFRADREAISIVIEAGPDIIAHNLETVPRLYASIRPQADYARSLGVLKAVKSSAPEIHTKSGIMLGLGEDAPEVEKVFGDAVAAGVEFFSIGQYLAPSRGHVPVERYVEPADFLVYKEKALAAGFKAVACGPYVRSSYQAQRYLEG